jgi:hypothetical protein
VKRIFLIIAVLIFALRLAAQSNATVRLALISESPETSAAADVLTVQLSSNPSLHLLERSEIQRIYREQGLSAMNRDYLKLGQVLGADQCSACSRETGSAVVQRAVCSRRGDSIGMGHRSFKTSEPTATEAGSFG